MASFTAIEIVLPGSPPDIVRLCSGGFVTFDVDGSPVTFDSEDSEFGTLGTISTVSDGMEASVVTCSITLYPRSVGLGKLTADGVQRSKVRVWKGVVDADTGDVIDDPELIFIGEYDTPIAPRGRNTGSLILECASQEQFQQILDDQIKLNNTWMQSVYGSTALGLIHVHQVATFKRYFQMQSPRGSITYGGSGSGGGGSGDGPGGGNNPSVLIGAG